jgi:hypothetical protein
MKSKIFILSLLVTILLLVLALIPVFGNIHSNGLLSYVIIASSLIVQLVFIQRRYHVVNYITVFFYLISQYSLIEILHQIIYIIIPIMSGSFNYKTVLTLRMQTFLISEIFGLTISVVLSFIYILLIRKRQDLNPHLFG